MPQYLRFAKLTGAQRCIHCPSKLSSLTLMSNYSPVQQQEPCTMYVLLVGAQAINSPSWEGAELIFLCQSIFLLQGEQRHILSGLPISLPSFIHPLLCTSAYNLVGYSRCLATIYNNGFLLCAQDVKQ